MVDKLSRSLRTVNQGKGGGIEYPNEQSTNQKVDGQRAKVKPIGHGKHANMYSKGSKTL